MGWIYARLTPARECYLSRCCQDLHGDLLLLSPFLLFRRNSEPCVEGIVARVRVASTARTLQGSDLADLTFSRALQIYLHLSVTLALCPLPPPMKLSELLPNWLL